jgi:hypothetical protein
VVPHWHCIARRSLGEGAGGTRACRRAVGAHSRGERCISNPGHHPHSTAGRLLPAHRLVRVLRHIARDAVLAVRSDVDQISVAMPLQPDLADQLAQLARTSRREAEDFELAIGVGVRRGTPRMERPAPRSEAQRSAGRCAASAGIAGGYSSADAPCSGKAKRRRNPRCRAEGRLSWHKSDTRLWKKDPPKVIMH